MSIRETIARECARCKHIAHAYLSPNEKCAFLQLVIGRKNTAGPKGFIFIEPVYTLKLSATAEVRRVIQTITQLHPDVEIHYVPYVFRPGLHWTTIYSI